MRTGKDVDWSHVAFATYAYNEFIEDVPAHKIVEHYVKMNPSDNGFFIGYYEDSNGKHKVVSHVDSWFCSVDEKALNAEEFIELFEGEETDPVPIIKELTGIDHEEYMSDVTYNDGTTELLSVKGKILLIGWSKGNMEKSKERD
jgi:hypothetical protein